MAPLPACPRNAATGWASRLRSFTVVADVEPFIERKTSAFAAHKTQQPKEGERDFLENEEDRRRFARNEYYIHAPYELDACPTRSSSWPNDLPGSTSADLGVQPQPSKTAREISRAVFSLLCS